MDFGALIGSAGLVALITGAVLFLPIQKWKAQRGKAKWLCIFGGIGFIAGLIISPSAPDAAPGKAESAKAAVAIVPASDVAHAKGDAISFAKDMMSKMLVCEAETIGVQNSLKAGDNVEIYRSARSAVETCSSASADIGAMQVPLGLPAKADSQFHAAVWSCSQAYSQRADMFRKMQEGVNGTDSVADRADTEDTAQDAGSMLDRCSEDMENAVESAGATKAEMKSAIRDL